jgi:hypothetical protein
LLSENTHAKHCESKAKNPVQVRVGRIAEGVLMLGGALARLWLLDVTAISFMKYLVKLFFLSPSLLP